MSATAEISVIANETPVFTAIIRPPKLAAISFLAVQRNSVTSLD